MEKEKIVILLASYNGENFIGQQIESILRQDYSNWELWIRDDCSTDNTMAIIRKYKEASDKIIILENEGIRLGAQLNFGALMQAVSTIDFDYCMFSDQDDVWDEDKVLKSLNAIIMNSTNDNYTGPALLHTDFQYVDKELNTLERPINPAVKLKDIRKKIALIANDSYLFGCTMILNKSLLELAIPVLPEAENHDFWVSLHAAAFGRIYYLNEQTMLYRQHGNNVTGGLEYSSWKNRLKRIFNFEEYIFHKRRRSRQFEAFVNKERAAFDTETITILDKYLTQLNKGGPGAVIFMIGNGFKLRGFYQSCIYYVSVLIDRK